MPKGFRDAALTAASLLALFGILVAFNPDVRANVKQIAGGNNEQLLVPARVVSGATNSTGTLAMTYAADHSYMVFFLIVGGFLFILMLRT
jgi:hypothetical protein